MHLNSLVNKFHVIIPIIPAAASAESFPIFDNYPENYKHTLLIITPVENPLAAFIVYSSFYLIKKAID